MHRFIQVATFVGLVLSGSVSRAQSNAAAAQPLLQTQVSFLVVAGAPEFKSGYFESTKQKVRVPVAAGTTSKSTPLPYVGPASFVLHGAPPPAAGGQAPGAGVPVARVELPKAAQVLVLLGPAPTAPAQGSPYVYTAFAVADDWTTFPPGTARVLNYSGKRIQVLLGDQTVPGDAGPGRPVRVAVVGKPDTTFKAQIGSMEAEGLFPAYANALKIRPDQRGTLVVLPRSPQGGRGVTVVFTRETAPPGLIQPAAPQQPAKRQ